MRYLLHSKYTLYCLCIFMARDLNGQCHTSEVNFSIDLPLHKLKLIGFLTCWLVGSNQKFVLNGEKTVQNVHF